MGRDRKPSIAIIRGSQPRMTEINFYSYFNKFDVKVIGDQRTGWVIKQKIPTNVKFIDSPLYPVWGFDPWTKFFGNYHAHRSFQFVTKLQEHVSDCDILNVSDLFYFYCWQTARIAKRTGKKLMAIVWETIPQHVTSYVPPYSFCVNEMLKQTDLFVARSNLAKKYLLSIGANPGKIKVIYKGIDINAFKPKNKKHFNKLVILYVGQFVKSKGVMELIKAFEYLCKEFNHLELWMLGRSLGEPLEKDLIQISTRLPLIIKSQIAYDELPKYYQQADIYCQLSQDMNYVWGIKGWNEWFSYAIIEAMASGLPIVATDNGGIPEQLGNNGNLIVPQKDTYAAYMALKKLILDKGLRRSIGQINRDRAKTYFDIKEQALQTQAAALNLIK